MRKTWQWSAVGVGLALIMACGGPEAPAAESDGGVAMQLPPIAPRTSLREVMIGLVDHAAHGVWDLERPQRESEEELDWDEVMHNATQLVASGSYISWGGTGELDGAWVERPRWRDFSEDMIDAGIRAYDAAIIRDLDGVLAAGDELAAACNGCHQEYRLELPSEGRGREHPH
jgi:hypothetical protein